MLDDRTHCSSFCPAQRLRLAKLPQRKARTCSQSFNIIQCYLRIHTAYSWVPGFFASASGRFAASLRSEATLARTAAPPGSNMLSAQFMLVMQKCRTVAAQGKTAVGKRQTLKIEVCALTEVALNLFSSSVSPAPSTAHGTLTIVYC